MLAVDAHLQVAVFDQHFVTIFEDHAERLFGAVLPLVDACDSPLTLVVLRGSHQALQEHRESDLVPVGLVEEVNRNPAVEQPPLGAARSPVPRTLTLSAPAAQQLPVLRQLTTRRSASPSQTLAP
eukprot:CAMPEP_0173395106 /NCGR_PEP_ID=MMETSP1356-20130122/30987_1 /TAXON_ID=77927 ORGANISM="Hemiselmis virescens, Strain PCC157" /NCGR_SAMPLE_ID=MMETSP1356 /ASSEMBLY_ACC=CAM_ASM_000847 /LENGTH=124 /DNA_ID=CAMNT_0014353745 /DNA_START=272 /DNA_END=641 /DNA_ORIENTATION=-